jgi:hypothetical protein
MWRTVEPSIPVDRRGVQLEGVPNTGKSAAVAGATF